MKKNEFNETCQVVLNSIKSTNLDSKWQLYLCILKAKFKLSAFRVYRPTIMNIGKLYHQYKKDRYENLLDQVMASTDTKLKEDLIEKYEAHDFALTFGRAYGKEDREWCLNKAKEENITAQHLPFLIWNGDLNPRNKSFLKDTKEIMILQGFFNLMFTLMMLNALLLIYLDDDKPPLLRVKLALGVCLVTIISWTFYNPYSIGLYRVSKNYSKRNYKVEHTS